MAGKIHLSIVTPERRLLEAEVDEVVLPGELGYFGILPGHAPYLVRLGTGEAD
jgi:F-type H+-transporting ATPase subunit epsilon